MMLKKNYPPKLLNALETHVCTITGVSQAFRWKFAGAKHLRRMEAADPRRIGDQSDQSLEVLQGKKSKPNGGVVAP